MAEFLVKFGGGRLERIGHDSCITTRRIGADFITGHRVRCITRSGAIPDLDFLVNCGPTPPQRSQVATISSLCGNQQPW